MKFVISLLAIIVIATGVFVFLKDQVTYARAAADAVEEAAPSTNEVSVVGAVVRYERGDHTLYYLLYEYEEGEFRRAELKFSSGRGCNVSEGDLPCVPGTNRVTDPSVPVGSVVRVTGTYVAPKIYVESIEEAESDAFAIVEVSEGNTRSASGIEIDTGDIRYGSKNTCEVFLGCYDAEIPRTDLLLVAGKWDREVTLVPGMLASVPGGVVSVLEAEPDRDAALLLIARS